MTLLNPVLTVSKGLSGGFKEVAKCKSCPFELEWAAVERDLNNERQSNPKTHPEG